MSVVVASPTFAQETAAKLLDVDKEVPAGEEPKEDIVEKRTPTSAEHLMAIQKRVQDVLGKAKAATVGVLANGSGSGVIISEDGYVLTAGHVSGEPEQKMMIVLPDGRHVNGESLGNITFADGGLIKITDEGPFPWVEMGDAGASEPGDWCFVLGHPGGVDEDRGMVLRIGRVIRRQTRTIQTDCRLVGGDSGGPLFDLDGRVIGINSRIKPDLEGNYHVAIRMFKRYWEEMREGKIKRTSLPYVENNGGYLGVYTATHARGVLITRVERSSPAWEAGLRSGNLITHIDGQEIDGLVSFQRLIRAKSPGDIAKINFEHRRKKKELDVTLSEKPPARSR